MHSNRVVRSRRRLGSAVLLLVLVVVVVVIAAIPVAAAVAAVATGVTSVAGGPAVPLDMEVEMVVESVNRVAAASAVAAPAAGTAEVFFRNPLTGQLARSGASRTVTDVPSGTGDQTFVGVTVDDNTGRVYYANASSIVRVEVNGVAATVVPRVDLVLIGGVNLGESTADLVAVELHGIACTSKYLYSPTLIACVTAHPGHLYAPITPFDVSIVSQVHGRSNVATNSDVYARQRVAEGYFAPLVSSVRRVARSTAAQALAFEPKTNSLFWSDPVTGTIHRSDPSGKFVQLVATGLFEVYGLATSWPYLYYTDHDGGRVVRVNITAAEDLYANPGLAGVTVPRVVQVALGGRATADSTANANAAATVVLRGFKEPRGIALDAASGYMFLTESAGRIFKARMDGKNMQRNALLRPMFVQLLFQRPSGARLDGIAVSHPADGMEPQRIFWTEANTNAVFSATVYGVDLQKIAGDAADMVWPRAIALRHTLPNATPNPTPLYWTQFLGRVHRAAITGASRTLLVDGMAHASGYAQIDAEVSRKQLAGIQVIFNVQ